MKAVKVTFKPNTFEDFLRTQQALRDIHMSFAASYDAMPPFKFQVTCRCPTFHAETILDKVLETMPNIPVVKLPETQSASAYDLLVAEQVRLPSQLGSDI